MIEVSVDGSEEMLSALDRLSRELSNPRSLMQEIGEGLLASTKARFKDSVGPDGSAWIPKSAATMDAYRARGDTVSFRPLRGPSGRLAGEIAYTIGINGRFVEIGSNQIYAGVMQHGARRGAFGQSDNGSPIPWGDIPARPFLGLSAKDEDFIMFAIDEWLKEATSG